MKNILIVENLVEFNNFNSKLNLEELGMIYYLKNLKEKNLDNLLNDLSIKVDKFRGLIQNLEKKKIIKLDLDVKNKEFVCWKISFIKEEIKVKSNLRNLFILSEEQVKNLEKLSSKEEVFFKAYKIYELNKDKYKNDRVLEIKTKEEYIKYLKEINPIVLFGDLNVSITTKELYALYDAICIKNKDKAMVNLLIDYVISTSVYNNFSLSFFNKVLDNWEENDIDDINKAIEYVKQAKEKINSKNTSNYEEPVWEELSQESIEVEDVDKLLKEFGNK